MDEQNVATTEHKQDTLPNSTGILVLGILSIPFACCCFVGLIPGVIALTMADKSLNLYKENPELYSEKSYNNVRAGKILAVIGVVLSAIMLLWSIIDIFFIKSWDEYVRQINEAMEQFKDLQ